MLPQPPSNRNQSSGSENLEDAHNLRELVAAQINRQQHFQKSADLIDLIIEKYPDCPQFASMLVDRLMAGDEALAEALQAEGF